MRSKSLSVRFRIGMIDPSIIYGSTSVKERNAKIARRHKVRLALIFFRVRNSFWGSKRDMILNEKYVIVVTSNAQKNPFIFMRLAEKS